MSVEPRQIKLNRQKTLLTLIYDDGDSISIAAAYLRAASPSAANYATLTNQSDDTAIMITALTPIGHYAVKISFSDGHHTGLYRWDYLRYLARYGQKLC